MEKKYKENLRDLIFPLLSCVISINLNKLAVYNIKTFPPRT